jgi:uncharacterized membrane-anchored protein
VIVGKAYKGKKTKDLLRQLPAGSIAIIDHADIDRISAEGLVATAPKAVINAAKSISGRYPNVGPGIINAAGILLIDDCGDDVFTNIEDGAEICIKGAKIFCNSKLVATGTLLTGKLIADYLKHAERAMDKMMADFVKNTVEHLNADAVALIFDPVVPEIKTNMHGRQALVVVRGYDYKADLKMLNPYIHDMRPILIAVDGGADALIEMGLKPDIIIGDMDSITDDALLCGAEIIPHAYTDGTCPSLPRLQGLGIQAEPWPLSATSEDLALLLAWEKKAELIVALGTHSNLVEYLDKGRSGMASSFLVRLKVGTKLVDAKGVSKLYRAAPPAWQVLVVLLATLFVVASIIAISEPLRDVLRVLWLNLRTNLGI